MIEKKITVKPAIAAKPIAGRAAGTQTLNTATGSLFHKENFILMLAGLVVIAIGMMVMSGGKSSDPKVFDQNEVYSATRITIAPILILIGLCLEVFAIFKKPKTVTN